MLTPEKTLGFMSVCFKGLQEGGMIDGTQELTEQTILIGGDSALDSIAFVSFITDLEDRVSSELGKDFYIVLNEIQDFNINTPYMTVSNLIHFILEAEKKGG